MRHLVSRSILASAAALTAIIVIPSEGAADPCAASGEATDDLLVAEMTCSSPGGEGSSGSSGSGGAENAASDDSGQPTYLRYRWHSPCTTFSAGRPEASALDCGVARACPRPSERSWQLWGFATRGQTWEYITSECYAEPPTVADAPEPQPVVTPALVLNAIRQIGLPSLEAVTQPEDKTLVNFATIFYTEPQPFTRTVTLLGQSVEIEATPSEYTWHHGDGTTVTTTSPGAPYPSKEITYSYTDADVTVAPSVDVTYTARFRVSGGGWQGIDETVTIAGPPTALRVSEATALLSGEYE